MARPSEATTRDESNRQPRHRDTSRRKLITLISQRRPEKCKAEPSRNGPETQRRLPVPVFAGGGEFKHGPIVFTTPKI
jgi:hypothetical protein